MATRVKATVSNDRGPKRAGARELHLGNEDVAPFRILVDEPSQVSHLE